jgi:outer membrane immunogenic protein
MYRKLLLASVGAIALTGSAALAAEPPPPPPPPPPPLFTWTGAYVGVQIGGAWGAGNLRESGFDPFTRTFFNSTVGGTPSGVIGGAHVGYLYQINQWVLGIEGSVDGTSLSKTTVAVFPNVFGGGGLAVKSSTSFDVQGSIRGKIGFAWDRLLIYGTGGVAFGGFNTNFSLISGGGVTPGGIVVPPFFANNSFSNTRVGWTAGGGLQYAVTNNWWVFAEYRFSDFGTLRNGAFPNLPSGVFFNGNRRVQDNQVQGGISYKFDTYAPVPVVAKY